MQRPTSPPTAGPFSSQLDADAERRFEFARANRLYLRIAFNCRSLKGPEPCVAITAPAVIAVETFRCELAQRALVGLDISTELLVQQGCVDIIFLPRDLRQGSLLGHHTQLTALAESTAKNVKDLRENIDLGKLLPVEKVIQNKGERVLMFALAALKESGLTATVVIDQEFLPLETPDPLHLVTCKEKKDKESHRVNRSITGIDIGQDGRHRIKLDYSQWIALNMAESRIREAAGSCHSLDAKLKYQLEWAVDVSDHFEIYLGPPDPARNIQRELDVTMRQKKKSGNKKPK